MGAIKGVGDIIDDIIRKYAEVYPEASIGSMATCAGIRYLTLLTAL